MTSGKEKLWQIILTTDISDQSWQVWRASFTSRLLASR
jgi:hypothetical protein